MFVFYCVFINSFYCGYVCSFCRDHIFADFVSFLSMIIYEILNTLSWCLRYTIYSTWFLDVSISIWIFRTVFLKILDGFSCFVWCGAEIGTSWCYLAVFSFHGVFGCYLWLWSPNHHNLYPYRTASVKLSKMANNSAG